MHLTAGISSRKKELLVLHTAKSVMAVFQLAAMEVMLGIVSVPTYLMVSSKSYETGGQANPQFRMRKYLTLLLAGAVVFVIGAKIALPIIQKNYVAETSYSADFIQQSDATVRAAEIFRAPVDVNLRRPDVKTASFSEEGLLQLKGTGIPNWPVIAIVEKANGGHPMTMLFMTTDENGVWSYDVSRQQQISIAPGDYELRIFHYDPMKKEKSSVIGTNKINNPEPWPAAFFTLANNVLNIIFLLILGSNFVFLLLMV